ncbi:MAG: hypothetical protein HBSAPP04_11860 [Ignavibacteriaceae bacterium]|nr:MAG: hypothetical protein EDM75_01935 [Chlorobiota bacterium]GJQ32347.1 MAG: hypothetical protein HBSAPP04_11860 [Ignavibacteriaceae bacterium]
MGKNKKTQYDARSANSYSRKTGHRELKPGTREPLIVLSFKDLDLNQGQGFQDWEEENLLALALNRLKELNQFTVKQALAQKFVTQYTKVDFPPESDFYHPKHVPTGVEWCSMHVQGKECVIGYFEDNIFHVVFLDKDHRFWITEKKHT